jgi:phosphoribosylglycinamide formyltransferase-1
MPKRKKIVVLLSGTGSNFAYLLKHLPQNAYEIVFVLSNNPHAKGIDIAKAANIPHRVIEPKQFSTREIYDASLVNAIQEYAPDLTVLAGFMRILTPVFTKNIRAINLHPSLLPRHKGLHAIEKSYEDEHLHGGVSVHWVSEALDGGEIIVQKELLKEGLSFEMYDAKIRTIEKEALLDAVKQVLGIKV